MFFRVIKLSILFVLLLAGYNTASASFTISRPSTNNLGLVGHWTFDGKNVVNGVALDSTGNANNGNLVNIATSTFYAAGKIGQGFNFDGVNDYVNMGDIFYSDIFTVCAWFKGNVFPNNGIVLKMNSSGVTAGTSEWLFAVGSVLYFQSWNSSGTFALETVSTSLNLNQWYHGCNVQNGNGNTGYLYLNGVENDNSAQTSAMRNSASLVQIGARFANNNTRYWNGLIDEVRIYNRALSAGEVKNLYNQGVSKFNKTPTNILTSGLVGHWTFDGKNVVNGVALDSSGNGNNGNLVNIATSTFYSAGKIGQGFNFDGVDDYINLGNPASLKLTGSMTISAWAKLSSIPTGGKYIISRNGSASNRGWGFMACGDCATDIWRFIISSNGTDMIIRDSVSTFSTVWTHVTEVYNASAQTLDVYINGVLDNGTLTGTVPASQFNSSYGPDIGAAPSEGGGSFFPGLIDDIRVYNRALSAGEIKMLYNMGR